MSSQVMETTSANLLPATAVNELSHLSQEQQMQLFALLTEIRSSIRRVEKEYVFMALRVGQMKKIMGDSVYAYLRQHLEMPRYVVERILLANQALTSHLADEDGRTDMVLGSRFTAGALRMFAPITDGSVIEEVKKLAGEGHKVNEQLIERVVKAHESDSEERILLAEAEAARARKDLSALKERHEIDMLRMKGQVDASAHLLRKAAEHREAMEQEVATLRSQSTIVTEKLVPKIPDEYTSIEDAISAANERLEQARQRESSVKAETERLISEQAKAKASAIALHANIQDFQEVQELASKFFLQYPQAKLKAVTNATPEQREAITAMARAMIEFGTYLQEAVAKAS